MMNNGDKEIVNNDFNAHFPAFFAYKNKQLSMTIKQDSLNNYIMLFGEVPVFYCQEN